jgi:hypothetical protein
MKSIKWSHLQISTIIVFSLKKCVDNQDVDDLTFENIILIMLILGNLDVLSINIIVMMLCLFPF